MTREWSTDPDKHARYGLGFWLAETGPVIELVGSDAGVSFYSAHDPTTGTTCTAMSNTSSGAWPIARFMTKALNSSG